MTNPSKPTPKPTPNRDRRDTNILGVRSSLRQRSTSRLGQGYGLIL